MAKEFNTRKRLMAVVQEKIRLQQQEHVLAKQLAKLHNNMAVVKQIIRQQQQKIQNLNVILNERDNDLEKRTIFEQAMREKLAKEKERISELQVILAQKKQDRDELMGYVRTLSEAMNIYFNQKALPERVKGVAVLPDLGQWVPFDFDARNTSGLNVFWTHVHQPCANAQKWQQLFSTPKGSLPTTKKNENHNISMSSVIEIDLTSPSALK